VDLTQKRAQVAREVVERAARRHHVHEPEERGAQLGVPRGEVHRLVVDRPERVACLAWQRRSELEPDAMDLCL
jgi:hypothetical protein